MDEDTLRCDLCGSLYHREPNCPKGPPPPRYKVKMYAEETFGIVERATGILVPGTLTDDEDAAELACDRLNAKEMS